MKKQVISIGALVLATMIWGTAFVAQSVGMDYIGPFTFQAVRCALAVIGLLPLVVIFDKNKNDSKNFFSRWKSKTLWIAGLCSAIPLFLAVNLQQIGLVTTDAGKSAFLTAMYIVFVPIIGIFLGKKPSTIIAVGVLLAVFGLYFLCDVNASGIQTADLCLLGCAVAFAVQITVIDRFVDRVDALRLSLLQSLFCALFSSVFMFTLESPSLTAISHCWIPLSYAGFLSMGLAYSLQIVGQKHVESAKASLIMSLESVFATVSGCLLIGDSMPTNKLIGCILIFVAVIVSQIQFKKK